MGLFLSFIHAVESIESLIILMMIMKCNFNLNKKFTIEEDTEGHAVSSDECNEQPAESKNNFINKEANSLLTYRSSPFLAVYYI